MRFKKPSIKAASRFTKQNQGPLHTAVQKSSNRHPLLCEHSKYTEGAVFSCERLWPCELFHCEREHPCLREEEKTTSVHFITFYFRQYCSPQSTKKNALYILFCMFNTPELFV